MCIPSPNDVGAGNEKQQDGQVSLCFQYTVVAHWIAKSLD